MSELIASRKSAHAAASALRSWGRRYWLVVTAFLLLLLLGLPTLIVPLATDQIIFALSARTILHGGFPYVDLWDIKPPGAYVAYVLSFLLFGERMVSVRILDLANTLGAMIAIFLLGRRLFSERAGLLAGCLYGLTYLTRANFDGLAETESFLVLPVVLALVLYPTAQSERSGARAALSGLLLGLAFSTKFNAGLYVLALPAMELLLAESPARVWPALRRLSLAAAGFLAVPVVFAVYLAAGGALGDFLDIQRLHVAHYTALHWAPEGESYIHYLARATHYYVETSQYLVVPAAVALFFGLLGKRRRETALVVLLTLAALAGVWSQGKFFPYHWLAMVPPLSLLAGHAIDRILGFYGGTIREPKLWAAAGLVAACLIALTPSLVGNPYNEYRHFLGYLAGSVTKEENEARYIPLLSYNHELVNYIEANSGEGESFFIWGYWPVAYWWADRPLVSRFVYDSGLRATWAPEKWRRELVDSLKANPPRYVVVAHGGRQPWLVGTSETADEQLAAYPELNTFINQSYGEVWNIELFKLYERK